MARSPVRPRVPARQQSKRAVAGATNGGTSVDVVEGPAAPRRSAGPQVRPKNGLDRYFEISARRSTVARELRGGLTTFFTMAYIVLLNPIILSLPPDPPGADINGTSLPFPSVAAVTALLAAADDDPHGRRRQLPVRAGGRSGHQRDRRRLTPPPSCPGPRSWAWSSRGPAHHRAGADRLPAGGLRGHPAAAEDRDRRRHRLLPDDHRARGRRHHPARHPADQLRRQRPARRLADPRLRRRAAAHERAGRPQGEGRACSSGSSSRRSWRSSSRRSRTSARGWGPTVRRSIAHGWALQVPTLPDSLVSAPDFSIARQLLAVRRLRADRRPRRPADRLLDHDRRLLRHRRTGDRRRRGGWPARRGPQPAASSQPVLLVDSLAAAAGGAGSVSSNTTYIESAAGVADGARTGLASIATGRALPRRRRSSARWR